MAISEKSLPLTLAEGGEAALNRLPVKPEVAEAFKPGQKITNAYIEEYSDKLNEAGELEASKYLFNMLPRAGVRITLGPDELFSNVMAKAAYNTDFGSLTAPQKYFIALIDTILKQRGINTDRIKSGSVFDFDFKSGSFAFHDPDPDKALLTDTIALKESDGPSEKAKAEIDAEIARLEKEGILYQAFRHFDDDPSFQGRLKFLKDHAKTLVPMINEKLTDQKLHLKADEMNLNYKGNSAQNTAYLKAYLQLKSGKAADAAPEPAEVAVEPVPAAVVPEVAVVEPVPAAVVPEEVEAPVEEAPEPVAEADGRMGNSDAPAEVVVPPAVVAPAEQPMVAADVRVTVPMDATKGLRSGARKGLTPAETSTFNALERQLNNDLLSIKGYVKEIDMAAQEYGGAKDKMVNELRSDSPNVVLIDSQHMKMTKAQKDMHLALYQVNRLSEDWNKALNDSAVDRIGSTAIPAGFLGKAPVLDLLERWNVVRSAKSTMEAQIKNVGLEHLMNTVDGADMDAQKTAISEVAKFALGKPGKDFKSLQRKLENGPDSKPYELVALTVASGRAILTVRANETNYTITRIVRNPESKQTPRPPADIQRISAGFEGAVYILDSDENRAALEAVLDADWGANSEEHISFRGK